jgi:uncharacterized membrane protein YdjX (TVP38/TMEM64 family)
MLSGLILAGVLLRLLPDVGASGLLARLAGMRDPSSAALFVLAAALLCAVGVPRQIVAYAAGYAFGFWPGTLLAMAAEVLGCAADFLWARGVARDWARARLARGRPGRLARLDAFLAANPFSATLTLRLLPVGNNLALNLLAGISGIALGPFLAGSALGYVPQTLIFALIGAGVRIDHATQLGVGVALFAASAGVGALLLRRVRAVAVS